MASIGKVNIKVLFFAKAKELAGVNESDCCVDSEIVSDQLLQHLVNAFELGSIAQTIALALNEEWVDRGLKLNLRSDDIVAVIPPLSGG